MLKLSLTLVVRLLLACVLGGFIGYEREHTNRPAGFRTHILVCVGAALVMATSEFIFRQYGGLTNIDPARLGAQVISGIGFLGAGTIIREGFSVKGLTTAASLWAVSCVGLAIGIGFYEGAVSATILIYITLIVLKKMEAHFTTKNRYRIIYVQSDKKAGQIGAITSVFDKMGARIKSIEFINNEEDKNLVVKFFVRLPAANMKERNIASELHGIEGVQKVYEG